MCFVYRLKSCRIGDLHSDICFYHLVIMSLTILKIIGLVKKTKKLCNKRKRNISQIWDAQKSRKATSVFVYMLKSYRIGDVHSGISFYHLVIIPLTILAFIGLYKRRIYYQGMKKTSNLRCLEIQKGNSVFCVYVKKLQNRGPLF